MATQDHTASGDEITPAPRTLTDELQASLYEIYRAAPFTDQKAYAKAQKGLKDNEELMFNDKEIDDMLPTSLRRSGRAAVTPA